jgi:hypothetical protein
MAFGQDLLNTPPPSPATNPTAQAESNPGARMAMLTQGMAPLQASAQPDLSGILGLGQKLSEGILSLQQALPDVSGTLEQARSLIESALAQYLSSQSAGQPASPPPGAVTQTGTQYPGGGFTSGKPF